MNKDVERFVEKLLIDFDMDNSFPIDPKEFAAKLGLIVVQEEFSDELSGVLVRKSSGEATIAINKQHPGNRQRFTIAHECGHFALRHKGELFVNNLIINKRDSRSSYALDFKEIEANAFAAALLMPRKHITKIISELLDRENNPSQKILVGVLAEKLRVSEQAIVYRLLNLGIITSVDDE